MRLEKLALAIIFMGLSALSIAIAIQRGSKTGIIKGKTENECESGLKFIPNSQAGISNTGKICTFWQDGTCYNGICEDNDCKDCEKELIDDRGVIRNNPNRVIPASGQPIQVCDECLALANDVARKAEPKKEAKPKAKTEEALEEKKEVKKAGKKGDKKK